LAGRPARPRQRQQGDPGTAPPTGRRRRVSQDAPRQVPPPSTQMDAEDTLAELLGCLADPTLKPEHRDALQRACDALQAAQALATAERHRYRALFDAVPDPVSVIAWDGTVLDLNSAGIAAYTRPRHEIVGQPIHVLNPELPRDHIRPAHAALSRHRNYVIDATNTRHDGQGFPAQMQYTR